MIATGVAYSYLRDIMENQPLQITPVVAGIVGVGVAELLNVTIGVGDVIVAAAVLVYIALDLPDFFKQLKLKGV